MKAIGAIIKDLWLRLTDDRTDAIEAGRQVGGREGDVMRCRVFGNRPHDIQEICK